MQPSTRRGRKVEDIRADYKGFEEKFKPKKTTDDCYTPDEVYSVVLAYVMERCPEVRDLRVMRPFKPGGDYLSEGVAERLKAERIKAERIKAERLKAERLKAERECIEWELSEREREIINRLTNGKKGE